MMQQLRRSMPLILWILVIAFVATIIFSWGMGGFQEKQKPGVVGIIGGREITREFYDNLVQQELAAKYGGEEGEERPETAERDLRNQIWDTIVEETILQREIERMGIVVSDSEIVGMVFSNPPEYVMRHPYFQTDEEFDITKYHQFLQDPRNRNQVVMWETSYRLMLLKQKYINMVLSTVEVTDAELLRRFEERNVMGKAKFLMFAADSMKMDSAAVTEAELEDYYFAHLEDFLVPEKRRIAFINKKVETSREDSSEVRNISAEIKQALDNAEDFGELAALYSDHHSAADSGKIGWFPRKRLEATGDSAVWETKPGDYTGPLETRFGVTFYLVQGRDIVEGEMQSDLRIIQLKYTPSNETRDILVNKMLSFSEEIKNGNFLNIAEAYGFKVDTSGYFDDGGFITGVGKVKSAADFAFNNPVGRTSEIYPMRYGWFVFKIIDAIEAHTQTLEEVRDDVFKEVYRRKQMEKAQAECEEFYKELPEPSAWEKTAQRLGYNVVETENAFRFGDYVKDAGRDLSFTAVLFRAEPGDIVGPLRGENGCYVIELTEKTPVDMEVFNQGKAEKLPTLLQSKHETTYKEWLQQKKKEIGIEDFRYLYYSRL